MMGVGIGSFLEGLAKGASIRRSFDAQGLEEERLQLAREAAQRDAEKWNYEKGILDKKTQWATEDRDYELGKRSRDDAEHKQDRDYTLSEHDYMTKKHQLDAPAEAAQREGIIAQSDFNKLKLDEAKKDVPLKDLERKKSTLETESAIQTAERAKKDQMLLERGGQEALSRYNEVVDKNINIEKNDKGADVFVFDGKKYATKDEAQNAYQQSHPFLDNYLRSKQFNDIINNDVANGRLADAKQKMEWMKYPGVRQGIETSGRLLQAYHIGDIDSVNKELKNLSDNPDYLTFGDWDPSAQIMQKDGKVSGLRVTMKNKKTGKESVQEFQTEGDIQNFISLVTDPMKAFENGKAQHDARIANQVKMGEKSIEAQMKMLESDNNSTNKMNEEAAKLKIEELLASPEFKAKPMAEQIKIINQFKQGVQSGSVAAPAPAAQPQRPPTFFGR